MRNQSQVSNGPSLLSHVILHTSQSLRVAPHGYTSRPLFQTVSETSHKLISSFRTHSVGVTYTSSPSRSNSPSATRTFGLRKHISHSHLTDEGRIPPHRTTTIPSKHSTCASTLRGRDSHGARLGEIRPQRNPRTRIQTQYSGLSLRKGEVVASLQAR